MAIDKDVKRKVSEDWQKAFPQLTLYARDKLCKVVGPVIFGLELIKLPRTEEYRPHFVVYPIWKSDVKTSLDFPIILKEYYNKRGFQYSIPYGEHNVLFSDVLDSVKKQTLLPFDGNISLKEMKALINGYSRTPPLSAAPNSYLQAALQEGKLKIALFISTSEGQAVLEQIEKRAWDINHFKVCGVDISKWLQNLQGAVSNRHGFLRQIEDNKQEKGIAKLLSSELTV